MGASIGVGATSMVVVATRDCVVCGRRPPYDNWLALIVLPEGRGIRWIHDSCVSALQSRVRELVNAPKTLEGKRK